MAERKPDTLTVPGSLWAIMLIFAVFPQYYLTICALLAVAALALMVFVHRGSANGTPDVHEGRTHTD